MKVEDSRMDDKTPFEDLLIGDCFIYNDEYFIKIDDACTAPNAFNLKRNEMSDFADGNMVVNPVNAKVVIG